MHDASPFGFAFPFRIDRSSGTIATSAGDEHVRESLVFLLQTEIGERVLRREHGAGLRALLHEPMNAAFLQLVRHQVGRAILEHEPRVQLVDLRLHTETAEARLEIEILYRVVRSQRTHGLRVSVPTRI